MSEGLTLALIADSHAAHLPTDKGRAGLWPFYEELFAPLRDKPVSLLEIGIASGGALVTYARWFQNARCLGIDKKLPPGPFAPFIRKAGLESRVQVRVGDQCKPDAMAEVIRTVFHDGADIIIDDASHFRRETEMTLRALWPNCLKAGGMYVIEDWHAGFWMTKYSDKKPLGRGGVHVLCQRLLEEMQTASWGMKIARILAHPRAFVLWKGE